MHGRLAIAHAVKQEEKHRHDHCAAANTEHAGRETCRRPRHCEAEEERPVLQEKIGHVSA